MRACLYSTHKPKSIEKYKGMYVGVFVLNLSIYYRNFVGKEKKKIQVNK